MFKNQYYYGIYTYYMDDLYVDQNTIINFRNTYTYGILTYYADDITISNNVIPKSAAYGISLNYINMYMTNGSNTSNVFNNIAAGTYSGIYTEMHDLRWIWMEWHQNGKDRKDEYGRDAHYHHTYLLW